MLKASKVLDSIEKKRIFTETLKSKLKINYPDDWYRIRSAQLSEIGAGTFNSIKKSSLLELLKVSYPERNWEIWKFDEFKARSHWGDETLQKSFMKSLSDHLKYQKLDDWYKVSDTKTFD